VQTSGVAVKVIPFGSTEASGTGTVAYSADGVVLYTPVQGETNYTSFVLIASKSGCIPATQTIVTTAESIAGTVSANVTKVGGTSQTAGDLAALINTLDDYIDTEVAAIKAKTDNLPTDPADASDIASSFSTVNSTLATIAGYLDTEIAAIKAKTDNLPSDPADASDISASFSTVNSTLATIAGYVDTEVASIKSTVDALATKLGGITLLKNWLGALAGKTADSSTLAEINATTAGAGFNNTTDSLEAVRDRGDAAWTTGSGGGGSGTGARTVTITVNDGTTALQNAIVRMTEGAISYTATTNASGVATFNLDDATYTVAITKQGYTYAGTTLVVDGTEAQTYSMTQISITPGAGSATTGYVTCLDNTGTAEADVTVYAQMIDAPTSGAGYAYDASVRTVTSDEDGVAELTGMIKGATYQLWRGKRASGRTVTIPSDAGSTYALPSLVGE